MINIFGSIRILENENLLEYTTHQIKYPRSRKKRIRKKFKKLWTRSFATPSESCFYDSINGVIYCHPQIAKQLKSACEEI